MDQSLQHYLQRPENRALAEAHLRKEYMRAIKQKEKLSALDFRAKVLEADLDSQKAIAPLLQNRVLRKIIQSFTNDKSGSMDYWACNPEVLRLLHEAKRKMDEGFVSEEEMESLLLTHLQAEIAGENKSGQAGEKMILQMEDLVSALNEHLLERRRGNQRYQAADFVAAKHCYERAKSILDLVQGQGAAEQEEIDGNQVKVLLNLAALHLATKEFSKAVSYCTEALQVDEHSRVALLRRAKAYTRMHEYQAADADLRIIEDKGYWSDECRELQTLLSRARRAGQKTDANLFEMMVS